MNIIIYFLFMIKKILNIYRLYIIHFYYYDSRQLLWQYIPENGLRPLPEYIGLRFFNKIFLILNNFYWIYSDSIFRAIHVLSLFEFDFEIELIMIIYFIFMIKRYWIFSFDFLDIYIIHFYWIYSDSIYKAIHVLSLFLFESFSIWIKKWISLLIFYFW